MRRKLLDLQERALGRKLGRREMAVMEVRRTEADHVLLIRTAVARPDRHRVTVANNDGDVLYEEGYDGDAAWVIEERGPARRVTNPIAVASQKRHGLWLAGRRSLNELERGGLAVEFLPEAEDATGRTLPAFRIKLDATVSKLVFLEPETGQILVERDEFDDADDEYQQLELHTVDTQEIEGMRFPRMQRVVDVETGDAVAQLEWISVEIAKQRASDLAPLRS